MRRHLMGAMGDLRFDRINTRLRGEVGGTVVVDSSAPLLVWEPRRAVCTYAVPVTGVIAELVRSQTRAAPSEGRPVPMEGGPPVLDPRTPFSVHSAAGSAFDIQTPTATLPEAAFAFEDPDLAGVVALDFAAFDRWLEEDDEVVGHPRDPYHRIDVRPTSRRVEVQFEGTTVAATSSSRMLLETMLPPRFYIPRDDVRLDLLEASSTRTTCAYKGVASYFSVRGSTEGADLAWTYEQPLHDATATADHIAFFNERVDLVVDNALRDRPRTPWSR